METYIHPFTDTLTVWHVPGDLQEGFVANKCFLKWVRSARQMYRERERESTRKTVEKKKKKEKGIGRPKKDGQIMNHTSASKVRAGCDARGRP